MNLHSGMERLAPNRRMPQKRAQYDRKNGDGESLLWKRRRGRPRSRLPQILQNRAPRERGDLLSLRQESDFDSTGP